jgi:hypothetical protein
LRIFPDKNKNRTFQQAATGSAGSSRRYKLFERAASLPWSTEFDDPILLPNGRHLLTLKDAADYITKLPKEESDLAQWQVAIETLMLYSRGGHAMLARIAFMTALTRNVVVPFNPDAKKHHWGKRKLKRDE